MRRLIIITAIFLLFVGYVTAQTDSLSNTFKQVKDSVVIIKVKQQMPIGSKQVVTAGGLGSGFLISSDGRGLSAV